MWSYFLRFVSFIKFSSSCLVNARGNWERGEVIEREGR